LIQQLVTAQHQLLTHSLSFRAAATSQSPNKNVNIIITEHTCYTY